MLTNAIFIRETLSGLSFAGRDKRWLITVGCPFSKFETQTGFNLAGC